MGLPELISFLSILAIVQAHPSPAATGECSVSGQFFSYHIHVLFWQHNSDSVAAAFKLRSQFMDHFQISEKEPCDDTNTTHGQSPNLCMIFTDFPSPAAPFLTCEWAAFVPLADFARTVPWMMRNRGDLDLLVHPNSGCEIADHADWSVWGGKQWELDMSAMHYDCPGCNEDDCKALAQQLIFTNKALSCGLKVQNQSFVLSDKTAFCQPTCTRWSQELTRFPGRCPSDCDEWTSPDQHATCEMYLASTSTIQTWNLQYCNVTSH